MDFSSVNYVQAIADARNISTAAEKLDISQPALSAHLKKLEGQLGVVLFDRARQPLELTEAGRMYLDYAVQAQTLHREFMQRINDIENLKRGKLTIAGAGSFNISYLPKAVAQFTALYPGIDIEIIDGNIPDISMKALNGQIDLFIAPPGHHDERLQYDTLLSETIFLCVPADWKINRRLEPWEIPLEAVLGSSLYQHRGLLPQVDFCAFRESPFILLRDDQHIGHMMHCLFDKYGFKPQKVTIAEQTITSYNLTLAGIGVSLMTESTIKYSNFRKHPRLYMADSTLCTREIYVAYPKHKYLSKAAEEFINILKISFNETPCQNTCEFVNHLKSKQKKGRENEKK